MDDIPHTIGVAPDDGNERAGGQASASDGALCLAPIWFVVDGGVPLHDDLEEVWAGQVFTPCRMIGAVREAAMDSHFPPASSVVTVV